MDVFVQIVASGLTLGAMYAVSTIGLALVYGSLNMLNMAHGALLALGGYAIFLAVKYRTARPVLLLAASGLLCFLITAPRFSRISMTSSAGDSRMSAMSFL
mgnify:CR=1 FL=1